MEKFGQLESEGVATENQVCRDIVREIAQFGVNQRQLLMIIRLLSFELEDMDQCREIVGVIDSFDEDLLVTNLGEKGSE